MSLPLCANPSSFLGTQTDVTYWGDILATSLKGHNILGFRYPLLPAWTLLPVLQNFSLKMNKHQTVFISYI